MEVLARESCSPELPATLCAWTTSGSPSTEKAKEGRSQHGEAASAKWYKTSVRFNEREVTLTPRVRLRVARLTFTREISLRRDESVAYFGETVQNHSKADHFFHWTRHVTLGQPFLSQRDSLVALPGTKGIAFPHGYEEGKALLRSNTNFRWPKAPDRSGKAIDLTRPFARRGRGFVASVLLDPRTEMGFGFSYAPFGNRKTVIQGGAGIIHSNAISVAFGTQNGAISQPAYANYVGYHGPAGTIPPSPRSLS